MKFGGGGQISRRRAGFTFEKAQATVYYKRECPIE